MNVINSVVKVMNLGDNICRLLDHRLFEGTNILAPFDVLHDVGYIIVLTKTFI